MVDYEKLYHLLADSVDAFFALLQEEQVELAVETLMRGRLCCMECEPTEE